MERDLLAESVSWVARSMPGRPSVPVLAGLLVEAADGQVTLSGFDYETSHRVTVPAQVGDGGKCLLPGRLVSDISKSLPSQAVDLSVDGARAQLVCGTSRFVLQTIPTDDFPVLPVQPAASGTVRSTVFAEAVAQVVTAAGKDDTMPVFTGVRMEIEGSTISLLATDRYRLAIRELEWEPNSPDISATALIPARVLAETAKSMTGTSIALSLADGEGDGIVGFEGEVSGGLRQTTTRLLDGQFPKVRSLMPDPAAIATRVRVETSLLVQAVKRVALVAERNAPVRLTLAEGSLTLDAGNGEEAQASESIEAQLTGEPVTVGFNPTYLLDGLSAIGTPVAQLAFTQATRPAELTGATDLEAEPRGNFRYVLMPVRLNS
ncbi:DNA polymerase III subunit beta [Kribbella sancticallisti]|uniref:Beta sliding clamp n=2 Tax=Kribbella sancticallisti TaxID=460087 RepID=A0ABP4Q2H6_9ACTN